MESLIGIKTDQPLNHSIIAGLVEATKSVVVLLPMTCTITTKDEAIVELRNYQKAIEQFL